MSEPNPDAGPSAQKRPAETSHEAPPEKQAKAIVKKPPTTAQPPRPATLAPDRQVSQSGILDVLSAQFTAPRVKISARIITVDTSLMTDYFGSLYDAIVNVLYPSSKTAMAHVITKANFVICCRYFTKARIDHVYSSLTGRRPDGRIGIAKAVELPKALADIINGIGMHIGQGGALKFIPRPEDNPAQQADRLQVLATYNILANFAHLVQDAKSAGHIRTGYTSSQEIGTAWWVITARKTDDPTEVAAVSEAVRVDSAFAEFTPADALLCAIVQRQNTGLEDNTDALLKWTFGEMENIPSIRVAYNIQA